MPRNKGTNDNIFNGENVIIEPHTFSNYYPSLFHGEFHALVERSYHNKITRR